MKCWRARCSAEADVVVGIHAPPAPPRAVAACWPCLTQATHDGAWTTMLLDVPVTPEGVASAQGRREIQRPDASGELAEISPSDDPVTVSTPMPDGAVDVESAVAGEDLRAEEEDAPLQGGGEPCLSVPEHASGDERGAPDGDAIVDGGHGTDRSASALPVEPLPEVSMPAPRSPAAIRRSPSRRRGAAGTTSAPTPTPKESPMSAHPSPAAPKVAENPTPGKCRIEGCDRTRWCRGLCSQHYEWARNRNKLDELGAPREGVGGRPANRPLESVGAPIVTDAEPRPASVEPADVTPLPREPIFVPYAQELPPPRRRALAATLNAMEEELADHSAKMAGYFGAIRALTGVDGA